MMHEVWKCKAEWMRWRKVCSLQLLHIVIQLQIETPAKERKTQKNIIVTQFETVCNVLGQMTIIQICPSQQQTEVWATKQNHRKFRFVIMLCIINHFLPSICSLHHSNGTGDILRKNSFDHLDSSDCLFSPQRGSVVTCFASMTTRWQMPRCTATQPASSTTPASPTATLGSSLWTARSTSSSLPLGASTAARSSPTTTSSLLRTPATSCPATAVRRSVASSSTDM